MNTETPCTIIRIEHARQRRDFHKFLKSLIESLERYPQDPLQLWASVLGSNHDEYVYRAGTRVVRDYPVGEIPWRNTQGCVYTDGRIVLIT